MSIHPHIFLLLLCCLASCKLKFDNQEKNRQSDNTSDTDIYPALPPEEKLPPMDEIRKGTYAILVTGNTSSFIRGLYQGEATFSSTNTPVIHAGSIRGNIRKELSFLYSQGLIRKLNVYFSEPQLDTQSYPLITYSGFRDRLPRDSVAATYTIASNYQFESSEGRLEVLRMNEGQIDGKLEGSFVSSQGDSIYVSINFRAVQE